MMRKILTVVFAVLMLLSASACNLKTEGGKIFNADTTKQSFAEKSTYYHNVFKDRIPELDFKESPVILLIHQRSLVPLPQWGRL